MFWIKIILTMIKTSNNQSISKYLDIKIQT